MRRAKPERPDASVLSDQELMESLQLMAHAMAIPSERDLIDCHACGGRGEITYNPSRSFPPDPQMELTEVCAACHGDGTQIRADLELLADAMAAPSVSRLEEAA